MEEQPLTLLLVEDDELDSEAFRRALRKQELDYSIQRARDGEEAFDLLRSRMKVESLDRQLVLLDLNMPGMNGHEFLAELRSDPQLGKAIVFVLTSSDHERDINLAYDQHVAGYFLKSEIDALIGVIENYAQGVRFPPVTM